MLNVKSSLTPLTHSIAGMLALQLTFGAKIEDHPEIPGKQVRIAGSLGTFGNTWTSRALDVPSDAASLVHFYTDLLVAQESLGSDFEAVLFDNLQDLYLR